MTPLDSGYITRFQMHSPRRLHGRDLLGSVLYVAPGHALLGLVAFIAVRRFDASIVWVGLIGSSAYLGYMWNLFFSSVTARLSLRRSLVLIMCTTAFLLFAGSFQRTVIPYCLIAISFSIVVGLFEVQYNTIVYHIYSKSDRARRLSYRQLAICTSMAVLSAIFGRISSLPSGHLPTFLTGGLMMIGGAFVFNSIRIGHEHRMVPFRPWEVVKAIIHDQRFKRVAVLLTIYGWVGAGAGTLLTILYSHQGFDEWQVGILKAITTLGTIFASIIITPRIKFQGGITNFRLCFSGTFGAMLIYLWVGLFNLGSLSFWFLALANFVFGISGAGFALAMQTTAISLAPPHQVTLYVNGLMVIQGLRGMLAPFLVAAVLNSYGMQAGLLISTAISFFCGVAVWVPGIDGNTRSSVAS